MPVEIAPEIIIETDTKLEQLYRVLIHNDNITPMDFVVAILTSIFYLGVDTASEIMLQAHFKGVAYVQTLSKSEAEKRVNKAHFAAQIEGYPLYFSIEPE